MHARMAWTLGALAVSAGGFVMFSGSRGQDRPGTVKPITYITSNPTSAGAEKVERDLSKFSALQRQVFLSARRGADWLVRCNRQDGRFNYGVLPALRAPLEGDNYLSQVGAAFALGRAARFTGDERYAAIARQALLNFFLDTTVAPQDPHLRYTALPSAVVNRLGAVGLLVLAVHELPASGDDLVEQAEQMCQYIRSRQRPDGSLNTGDGPATTADDPETVNAHTGLALAALMHSQGRRPAAWKTEMVRKALAYYRPWWRAHKSVAFVPWHLLAFSEAFLLTREQPFAEFVNEMSDWVLELQYVAFDPKHPLWVGGFMGWTDGKPAGQPPHVGSAALAEGLAETCRVARQAGDVPRYQRCREAQERCLQFLATLQYTEANTQHFADWYRPQLLGAFYTSHQDGNLRLDATQHAVCALVQYLNHVAEVP